MVTQRQTRAEAQTPSADPRVITRGVPLIVLTVVGGLLIVAPVAVAAALGRDPYDRLSRGYPGLDVVVITAILLSIASIGALLSVGVIVHLLFLGPAAIGKRAVVREGFEHRVLRLASGAWALCSGLLVVFTALDSNGVELSILSTDGALAYLFQASYAPTAWLINLIAALIVLFCSYFASRWTSFLVALWTSAIAVLAPVVSGQVLVGPDHDFGSDAAILQTVAEYAVLGPAAVYAARIASGRLIAARSVRRLLRVSSVGLPVMLVTDVVIGVFKLAGSSLLGSLTGWLIVCRLLFLVLACAVCALGLSALRSGRLRAGGVATGATLLGVAALGWMSVSVAMTREPPPQYFVPTSITQLFMGFDVDAAPDVLVLVTNGRPNILFIALAVVAVAVYLAAVRVLRRRGDRWPAGRTTSWVLGWVVVVVATNSGLGKYSAADFGIHMIVHMSLNMLAPGMLVLGGVVTLLLRATKPGVDGADGPHEWLTRVLQWRVLRVLYNPLLVFVLFIGSYYGLYLTPIFGDFMRFHWAHQLMNLHFLVVGYLYYSLSIGIDRPPRPLPHIGKLGYVLAAMPFHAFFGIILMTSTTVIAETFYAYLDLPWADLPAQQYIGGGVAWAGGEIPLMVVVVALGVQWARQDAREARRKDRHMDAGRDDEYDVYNEMLRRLGEREAAGIRGREER